MRRFTLSENAEPFAHDELKDNLNPVGRVYYSFSTLLCTPCSRSQGVALCLGAQSGEKRIREVVTAAGLSRFRRAAETPFMSSTKFVHELCAFWSATRGVETVVWSAAKTSLSRNSPSAAVVSRDRIRNPNSQAVLSTVLAPTFKHGIQHG